MFPDRSSRFPKIQLRASQTPWIERIFLVAEWHTMIVQNIKKRTWYAEREVLIGISFPFVFLFKWMRIGDWAKMWIPILSLTNHLLNIISLQTIITQIQLRSRQEDLLFSVLTARAPRTYNWKCYCLWFGKGTIKWSPHLLLWFLCASGVINYKLIDFIGTIKSFHEAQGRLLNDTYILPQPVSEEYSMTTMTTIMVCQNRKDILEFPFQ